MAWQDRTFYREGRRTLFSGYGGTSLVWWLLGANLVVFVLDATLAGSRRASWATPVGWGNFNVGQAIYGAQVWRFVTYQFIHANFWHLFFNMIVLFFFGRIMEAWWGSRRFLAFYLLCGMSGAVVFTLLSLVPGLLPGGNYYLVGASGSIFGVLVGAAMVAPDQQVLLYWFVPIKMRTLALFALAVAVLSLVVGGERAGGEAAHLGGAGLGAVFVKWPVLLSWADWKGIGWAGSWRKRWRIRRARRIQQREQHLSDEVDRILAKVGQYGLHSLSAGEKRTLRRATQRQRRAS